MTHIYSQLDSVVIAYDIDGALTNDDVKQQFIDDADTKKVITGIITARSEDGLDNFLAVNPDILVNAEFRVSSRVKVMALNQVKDMYPHADEYMYVGSYIRDRAAAMVAGWEYRQA